MSTLVSSIAGAMAEFLDRPYALYGHSLGAKVAFETAGEDCLNLFTYLLRHLPAREYNGPILYCTR
jgi:surfactin synthase thioesterase subunit